MLRPFWDAPVKILYREIKTSPPLPLIRTNQIVPKGRNGSENETEQSNNYTYYKIGPVVREEIFKFSWMYLCNFVNISLCKKVFYFSFFFVIISPWKNVWRSPSLNKFIHPPPKDALCYVWLRLAHWFCRWWFLTFVNVFSLFLNYIPLEKGGSLHLNKLEFPSSKDDLCQVWLKFAQWFFKICQCIFAIS